MSILVSQTHPPRRPRLGRVGPSVREVCLVASATSWPPGERVVLGGRAYRVASAQHTAADASGPCYVHLEPTG